ncbi:MAG: GNAT family N-acetyltransferase [Gammaproteobacteria bacterium]|nr:GNAT family N-acetyltransferase [Gammaproteobacteria bacterium]
MTTHPKHTTPANIELKQLNWLDAHALAKPIRTSVFIQEQHVPESEEWDDEDETSIHIIAMKNGEAVATARLTQKGKIGRMAVLKTHRKHGIGSMMLVELINIAKQLGYQVITLWSQIHAQGFYTKHGFTAQGDDFLDAGIPHIKMRLSLQR